MIDQSMADYLETTSDARVLWNIDIQAGGYRCGSYYGLNTNNSWMKIIYTS